MNDLIIRTIFDLGGVIVILGRADYCDAKMPSLRDGEVGQERTDIVKIVCFNDQDNLAIKSIIEHIKMTVQRYASYSMEKVA